MNILTCQDMRYTLFILLLVFSFPAQAQPPRNDLDQFEYTQQLTVNDGDSILSRRARDFFKLPFIVHWDSVAFVDAVHSGQGNIKIRIHHWLDGFTVPVNLKIEITVLPNGYRYSFRHLEASRKGTKYVFPLEQKPENVNGVIYEQLMQKTHQYISSAISYLKRYMSGE
jgi:hypothetical protein